MKKYFVAGLFISSFSFVSALTCTDIPKNLSKGSESSSVLLLQNYLAEKGFLKAKPNGYYGGGTETAVKVYQKSINVKISGQADVVTREAIKKESCINMVTNKASSLQTEIKKTVTTPKISGQSSVDFIIYDGKEIEKDYDGTANPVTVGGKLAYQAIKDGKNFIVYDGKEIGKEYDYSDSLVDIGWKLAYLAKKDNKSFIVYDGKEIGKEYEVVVPVNVGGKLAYQVWKDKKILLSMMVKKLVKSMIA